MNKKVKSEKNLNLKKNQEVSLTIEDFTKEGEGLGKYQGFPLFVKDTVIGDEVKVSITKLKKNYGYARLVELIKPSEDRVTPLCPVARQCGGCKLQQISYDKQLHFKKGLVEGCLTRIGGFEKEDIEQKMEPVYGMEEPWHYRNKAQFPVGYDKEGNLVAGFYAGRTHSIVANTNCAIQAKVTHPIVEKVLTYMRENKISAYDEKNHSGLIRHILTRVGFTTGEIMVCLIVNGTAKQLKNINKLVDKLKEIEGMTSIIVNTNTDKTNKILGLHCETVWGQDYIEDYIGDIKYQIGPLSFYQVNPQQTKVLYSKALEYADLKGQELVWDLYCGIGTISLFLAQKAKQVYGVEIIKEAIDDARRNATLNHMDNVEFFVGKAEEIVPAQYEKTGIHPDVIVVDPPRKGCDAALLNTMLDMAPERIVYVSCDPATLARDLKILCAEKYTLEKVAVVDQFSHSVHVETVVLLSHKKPDGHINVKVEFGEGEGNVPLDNMVLEYSFEMNAHNRTLLSQIQRASRSADAMRLYPGAFSETLVQLMKEKKLSNKKLADASLVGERTIQRLRNEEEYPTTIQTVLGLCYGLQLSVPEAEMLVGKTDFNIKPTNPQNNAYRCVLSSCAENSIYEINKMLESCGFEPLGSSKLG